MQTVLGSSFRVHFIHLRVCNIILQEMSILTKTLHWMCNLKVYERCDFPVTYRKIKYKVLPSKIIFDIIYYTAHAFLTKAYLSARGVVHRDLAARNILVGDEKVLKISDFGLSREGIYIKKSVGKIPLRWLSMEAMQDRLYSTASDVYVLLLTFFHYCYLCRRLPK